MFVKMLMGCKFSLYQASRVVFHRFDHSIDISKDDQEKKFAKQFQEAMYLDEVICSLRTADEAIEWFQVGLWQTEPHVFQKNEEIRKTLPKADGLSQSKHNLRALSPRYYCGFKKLTEGGPCCHLETAA